jgi:hypothetical protein
MIRRMVTGGRAAAEAGVGPRCDHDGMPTNDPDAPSPEAEVTPDALADPKLTRKEQARQFRRAAYQKAKQRRATDPRLIAIKEAMKLRQRAAYQVAKERRKLAVAEQDRKQRERQAEVRVARETAIQKLVKTGTKSG